MHLLREMDSLESEPRVVVGRPSNRASVTDLQWLLPVYMYALYQYGAYGPMTEGDLGWVCLWPS